MRRHVAATLVLLGVLMAAGCGNADDSAGGWSGDPGAGTGDPLPEADDDAGVDAAGTEVPPCPVNAEQVSDIVGKPMNDDGDCSFRDGISIFTITTASELAGESTFEYKREQAEQRLENFRDLEYGSSSYLATGELEGEAVALSDAGSYTVLISSLETDAAGYEECLLKVLDLIFA